MKMNTIKKSFVHYVTLNILSMIGLSTYILADTFFVANGLGGDGLAALNLSISIFSFIQGAGLMIGIGGATKYTILKAENDDKRANSVFVHSVLFSLVIGLVLFVIGITAAPSLSKLLGADEITFAMTTTYIRTILMFAPFFLLNNVLVAFVRNDKNPRLSMVAMLIGSFSNIILDYVFIFPLGMGMFGAAFATGLAPVFSMIVLSLHVIKRKNQFHFQRITFKLRVIKDICLLGTSALITELSSGIVLIVFNLVILKLVGNVGVAAYGIVANLALVASSVYTGIGQGIQPIASRSYGYKHFDDLKIIRSYSIVLSVIIAVAMYLVVYFISPDIVALFNGENNPTLEGYAVTGLIIYFIGFLFAGINIIMASYYSATEKPFTAFIISILRGGVAIIPLVLILSMFFGLNGVWISFPCAEAVALCVGIVTRSRKEDK